MMGPRSWCKRGAFNPKGSSSAKLKSGLLPLSGRWIQPLLASGAPNSAVSAASIASIKEALRENGLIDGRDYVLDARFAAGNYDAFPGNGTRTGPGTGARNPHEYDRLCACGAESDSASARRQIAINDPVGAGLVASLAKPGGYTTGKASLNEDLRNCPRLVSDRREPSIASAAMTSMLQ